MFDALTLNLVMVILSFVYFLMSIIIYRVRKEKYLLYYLMTFLSLTFTYILLFFQKNFPDWISFIFTNFLVLLSQLFVVIGVRVLYSLKPIAKRFFAYIVIAIIFLYYYTYINFSLNARVVVVSLIMAIILFDLIYISIINKKNVHKSINHIILSISLISSVVWLSRVVFTFNTIVRERYLVDQGFSTGIYYIVAMITICIWFSLFIWIETTQSVIKLEEKNTELSKLALIDNLTKLANRHYFDHDIEFLIAITNRNKSKLSMLMVDLDRFKLVNDTYGHLVGDEVLIQSSQILRDSVRMSDRIYRWGGEEFVIIIPETSNEQAGLVAEKICQNFRNAKFNVIGNITVSIGVASYDKDEPLEDWFKRVDLALYQAKQTGRDRWVSWLDDEALPQHFNRFVWTKDLESGNREIDQDHMLLASQVNKLHDLIINSYPIDTIYESIDTLTKHIREHFVREEAIILSKGFVNYMEHRSIHNRLLSEYEIILKKAMNGDISLAAFMSFLVEKVLINHINEDDKQFFSVVK